MSCNKSNYIKRIIIEIQTGVPTSKQAICITRASALSLKHCTTLRVHLFPSNLKYKVQNSYLHIVDEKGCNIVIPYVLHLNKDFFLFFANTASVRKRKLCYHSKDLKCRSTAEHHTTVNITTRRAGQNSRQISS